MKSKEFLTELANRPYEYVQTMSSPFRSRYRFNTEGNIGYTVQVDTDRDLFSGEPYVSIHFALENLDTGKRSIAVTGTGNALRVFTTVRNIALEQIRKVDPTFIRFTAGAPTPSRVKLYDTIATQAPKWFPGYVFNRKTSSGDDVFYQLKKKNAEIKEPENDK